MPVGTQQWTVASLATGSAALVSLLLAVATSHWIHMKEKCINTHSENISGVTVTLTLNMTLETHAGIWQLCTRTSCKW